MKSEGILLDGVHGALRHAKKVKMSDDLQYPGLKALLLSAHDFSSLKAAAPSVFQAPLPGGISKADLSTSLCFAQDDGLLRAMTGFVCDD